MKFLIASFVFALSFPAFADIPLIHVTVTGECFHPWNGPTADDNAGVDEDADAQARTICPTAVRTERVSNGLRMCGGRTQEVFTFTYECKP